MTRDEARLLLHARLDGELDAASILELEREIAADPELQREAAQLAALMQGIRKGIGRERAPDALRSAVDRIAAPPRTPWRESWRAMAAAMVLAAGLGSAVTWTVLRPGIGEDDFAPVITGHLRGMAASRPTDIDSSDRHVVKPWFNGRVAFAPRVLDLASDGFPLVGGRVDVIDGRPAATLVYGHRQHLISLTATPDPSPPEPTEEAREGYSLLRWSQDGITYRAVSDLGAADMRTFADLFRTRAAEP